MGRASAAQEFLAVELLPQVVTNRQRQPRYIFALERFIHCEGNGLLAVRCARVTGSLAHFRSICPTTTRPARATR